MIYRQCKNCSKEFTIKKLSEANRPNRQCCSRRCSCLFLNKKRYHNIGIYKICKFCNDKFFTKYSRERKRKRFCNVICALKWRNKFNNPMVDMSVRKKVSKAMTGRPGKKWGKKERLQISLRNKGKNHWNWQGGKALLRNRISKCFQYKQWRSDVFIRDNYTCQKCNKKGGYLMADHYPKSFSDIIREYNIKIVEEAINCKELWNIKNGRTLDLACHYEETFGKPMPKNIKKWGVTAYLNID